MCLVREHINEKFEEKSDPITDMGIGYLIQLQKRFNGNFKFSELSVNQLLEIGVNYSAKDNDAHYDLIKYAIDNGADLLWEVNNSLHIVQIIKVNKNYGKSDPKITSKTIWAGERRNIPIGHIWTSVKFRENHRPITKGYFNAIDRRIKELEEYKDVIIKSNVKLDKSAY